MRLFEILLGFDKTAVVKTIQDRQDPVSSLKIRENYSKQYQDALRLVKIFENVAKVFQDLIKLQLQKLFHRQSYFLEGTLKTFWNQRARENVFAFFYQLKNPIFRNKDEFTVCQKYLGESRGTLENGSLNINASVLSTTRRIRGDKCCKF